MLAQETIISISEDGTAWTPIGCITSYSIEQSERNEIETTCLSATEKTFKLGLRDPGTMSLDLEYEQDSTGQGMLEDSYASDDSYHFKIEYNNAPSGGTPGEKTFEGYVSALSETGSVDDLITESVSIRVTGNVTNTDPAPAP